MTHDELVERVARAIYERRNGAGCKPWSMQPQSHKEPYRDDARIAIAAVYEALKEPTDEMCAAGYAAPQAYGMADNREELARMRTQPAYTAMLAASPARGSE